MPSILYASLYLILSRIYFAAHNLQYVLVECVRLVAGVKQPHLARVGLIVLGGGVGLHNCGA